jgi:hypothetical protein
MREGEPHLPLKSRIMSYDASGRDNADEDDIFLSHCSSGKNQHLQSFNTCIHAYVLYQLRHKSPIMTFFHFPHSPFTLREIVVLCDTD